MRGAFGIIKNVRYDVGGLAGVNECKGKAVCVRRDGNICFRSRLRDTKYDNCPSSVVLALCSAVV